MFFCDRFREIVRLYPDNPAIVAGEVSVSYRELDQLSDKIAAELTAQGLGHRSILSIRQECDENWIARMLGIVKTGAAYMPVSATTPDGHRSYIPEDIEAKENMDDGMIIYYTAGSAGSPKGVVLSRTGVMSFCAAHCELLGYEPGVKVGAQADVGSDMFLLASLPTLYAGGIIYLMNSDERTSLIGIHHFLKKHKIDTIFLNTHFAVQYMRCFNNKHLKALLTGGESLCTYKRRSYAMYNLYGPTECTVYVTAHRLTEGDAGDIPIGAPTGRNRIYIEDGELCVSGPQLALGYLDRPEETAEKFVANPHYNPETDDPCYARMYRTGDLAEWDEQGELHYRGRIGEQVGVGGRRIEPGEVEAALDNHPELQAVHVTVSHWPDGTAYLTAYCVALSEGQTPEGLKTFLEQSFPDHEIPCHFVMLESLPLDPRTGKVNPSLFRAPE